MMKAFIKGINVKRMGMAIVAVFVFVFASDFVVHQLILGETYKATPQLWRAPEEMQSFFPYLLLGQILFSIFFTMIFARGYEGKGVGEGIRFGALIGFLFMGPILIQYATSPLPANLLCSWIISGLVQQMLAGAVAALVYKR